MTRIDWDKTELAKQEIKPLMDALAEACEKHKLPHILLVQHAFDGEGSICAFYRSTDCEGTVDGDILGCALLVAEMDASRVLRREAIEAVVAVRDELEQEVRNARH